MPLPPAELILAGLVRPLLGKTAAAVYAKRNLRNLPSIRHQLDRLALVASHLLIMELPELEDLAGWIAPAATMIAAMMTAANLGARVTRWGFGVFTLGSIAWSIVGFSSGQTNLLATNGFLTLVNLIGVWRWLGKQRAYEDGGKSATLASQRSLYPTLFTATSVAGMPVVDAEGETIGHAVEALVSCESGRVSYVVVASGGWAGVDEELRAVDWTDMNFASARLTLLRSRAWFDRLAPLPEGEWPAAPAEFDERRSK